MIYSFELNTLVTIMIEKKTRNVIIIIVIALVLIIVQMSKYKHENYIVAVDREAIKFLLKTPSRQVLKHANQYSIQYDFFPFSLCIQKIHFISMIIMTISNFWYTILTKNHSISVFWLTILLINTYSHLFSYKIAVFPNIAWFLYHFEQWTHQIPWCYLAIYRVPLA